MLLLLDLKLLLLVLLYLQLLLLKIMLLLLLKLELLLHVLLVLKLLNRAHHMRLIDSVVNLHANLRMAILLLLTIDELVRRMRIIAVVLVAVVARLRRWRRYSIQRSHRVLLLH